MSVTVIVFFFNPCDHWQIMYLSFQVDEIYHDESLGTNINVVLVRMIMVGYRQVSYVTLFFSPYKRVSKC